MNPDCPETTRREDSQVFSYLKSHLEPQYDVVAQPCSAYFSQWQFRYQVLFNGSVVEELAGDFRDLPAGSVSAAAQEIVRRLSPQEAVNLSTAVVPESLPIASRLVPRRSSTTWFGSGRAAFAWLLGNVLRARRVFLPSYICWSLVDVLNNRFPDTEVCFYPVTRTLDCRYPSAIGPDDALLFVHYFGRLSERPNVGQAAVIEDLSHLPVNWIPADEAKESEAERCYRFGSLRKAYRVADGGFLHGSFNPHYETAAPDDAWLRLQARDWKDLREAENMTDRSWAIRDISSQSLEVILTTDTAAVAERRHQNNQQLVDELGCGQPVISFAASDFPLLHNRQFESTEERDSLRDFLLRRQVFTSIHWPMHDQVLKNRDRFDVEDALWLANHTFAIPVSEDFGPRQMDTICDAARAWRQAGAARFVSAAAGQ